MQLLEAEQAEGFKARLPVNRSFPHNRSRLGAESETGLFAMNRQLLELRETTLQKKSVSLQVRDQPAWET